MHSGTDAMPWKEYVDIDWGRGIISGGVCRDSSQVVSSARRSVGVVIKVGMVSTASLMPM